MYYLKTPGWKKGWKRRLIEVNYTYSVVQMAVLPTTLKQPTDFHPFIFNALITRRISFTAQK